MKESKIIEGHWAIFGNGNASAIGRLSFDPESNLALTVQVPRNQSFKQMLQSVARNEYKVPSIIRGHDNFAKPVTLFGCALVSHRPSLALETFTIWPTYALVGAHYNHPNDAVFQDADVAFSLIDAWLLRSSLTTGMTETGHFQVTQSLLPNILINLPNDVRLSISVRPQQITERFPPRITLGQRQITHFEFQTQILPDEIWSSYIQVFGRFLSVLTGCEIFTDEVKFREAGELLRDIEWLSVMPGITAAKRDYIPQALVNYVEIAPEFPGMVSNWFQYHARMEAVLNLYFIAISNPNIPPSTRFLLLAQALEAYHSRSERFVNESESPEKFRQRRETLISNVPEDERDWLRDKLRHANQKTLAGRLNELIADQHVAVSQFIPDPALFANTVRWTRNYYTHFSQDEEDKINRGEGRIASGGNLFLYSIHMRALLELLFIADLRLPPVAIARVIDRTRRFRLVAH